MPIFGTSIIATFFSFWYEIEVTFAMGYLGVDNIVDLAKYGKFIKITQASLKESHPHDIDITKESPNYQVEK